VPSGILAGRRLENARPPALVLGSGITALSVVHALGRAGIPLYVISDSPGFVRASRWYRAPRRTGVRSSEADLGEYLRALPLERAVLIPTSDHAALAVADLPPDIAARFPASQSAAPLLKRLVDKEGLASLLAEHGVPHPCTIPVDGSTGAALPADVEIDRWFVKPRDSQEFSRRMKEKALRVDSREELHRALERVASAGLPVVLQEYVPGASTAHYFLDGFVDREGVVRARFARRRLRMSAAEFGNSCATVSIPLEEMAPAVADLERFFATVGYRGPFDAEFKLDERRGDFRLLEVNVRSWWQIEFAQLCGIDVVGMIYDDALGLPVDDACSYPVGRTWILPYLDAGACRRERAEGNMTLGEWARSWIDSKWGGFATDDPLPGLAQGMELMWRHTRRTAASWLGSIPSMSVFVPMSAASLMA
jgi:D-aspartate ligase